MSSQNSGIIVGKNHGHTVTPIKVPSKPSYRKGVQTFLNLKVYRIRLSFLNGWISKFLFIHPHIQKLILGSKQACQIYPQFGS